MSPGMVVQLRCGGAPMVVVQVNPGSVVLCVWHDTLGRPHKESYLISSLKVY